MKIRRYVAKDMREAFKQLREQQGPDAVILHTGHVGDQVEVVAAVDFDPETFANTANEQSTDGGAHNGYDFAGALPPMYEEESLTPEQLYAATPPQDNVRSELNALRRMLETQLAVLAWNDVTRRAPVHTEVLKTISALGMTVELAAELVSQLPMNIELAEAQRMVLALFTQRIPTAPERWLDQGGVVALVGPTGVGKTSVLAKLAARWALNRGVHDLALVCADNERIGAHEHLQSIGRLLGAPSFSVDTLSELPGLLRDLERRKLVLIDTAGLSQRDARLAAELGMIAGANEQLETTLVLSASSQAGVIEESLQRFALVKPASCVLTKLDEAASLGGALSAVVRAGVPISYVTEGQRFADELHPARGYRLVARAVQLARNAGATADEDLLSRRFGGIAHGLV